MKKEEVDKIAVKSMRDTKNKIVDAIDYRLKQLEIIHNQDYAPNARHELLELRRYVKGILYKSEEK